MAKIPINIKEGKVEVDKELIIGIDLGTTNSAVSYIDLTSDETKQRIEIFPIPQLSGPGEVSHLVGHHAAVVRQRLLESRERNLAEFALPRKLTSSTTRS